MTSQGGRSGGGRRGAEARLAAVWDTFYGQQWCQAQNCMFEYVTRLKIRSDCCSNS